MRLTFLFRTWYVLICLLVLLAGWKILEPENAAAAVEVSTATLDNDSPESLRLYYLIEKYSKQYGVPKHIAYNMAYRETRFQGPFHWHYNPYVTSSGGAIGAMQMKLATASEVFGGKLNAAKLNANLDLNVKLSMCYLHQLYRRYKNWGKACGCYNTGKPIENEYATYCINNKDYKAQWVYFK
jgi:soluble lytic murein transglycosylase-like protein